MQQFPVNKLLKRNTLHTSINQPHWMDEWMVCKYILNQYDESPNLARQRNTHDIRSHTQTHTHACIHSDLIFRLIIIIVHYLVRL